MTHEKNSRELQLGGWTNRLRWEMRLWPICDLSRKATRAAAGANRTVALVAEEGEQVRGPVRRRNQVRGPVRRRNQVHGPVRLAVRLRRLGKVDARVLKGEFRQLWPAHTIIAGFTLPPSVATTA